MQCAFVTDVDVDPSTMPESEKTKIKFRMNQVGDEVRPIPYFPAGTIYDHPNAFIFCRAGSAAPHDQECIDRTGLSETELKALQQRYKRTAAGILKEDWELFDSGIITGYDHTTGEYLPGPNYAAWHAAKTAAAAQATSGTDI